MHVTIRRVVNGDDFQTFLSFPYALYHNSPLWVPPIQSQDAALLTPTAHPFWKSAERELFLAYRGKMPVGRIAAIIDYKYIHYAQTRCGAFGFFECEDDEEAANALLCAAGEWLNARRMDYVRGPVNPSTNYTCALLVHGFDLPPSLMMPWNPPYYAKLLEKNGFYKEEDLFAYTINRDNIRISPHLQEQLEEAKKSSRFSCRCADRRNLTQDIQTMLDLYRSSWAKNWYFSPLSKEEEAGLVEELLPIVDTDFFVLFFHNDIPCAGMVALPDLTPLLRKLKGSFSLMTPFHFLQTKACFEKGYRIMLFGIREEFRLFGLPALLFDYMLKKAQDKPNLEWIEGSWVLESNHAICDLIEDFSGTITKRYRIYRKELS